jgi:acyl-CoA synthetase (AMP-forming)/AMP-acid ligase II
VEACVVGIPHERWGESGVAILVTDPAVQLDEVRVLTHLDGRLAKYKWPIRVAFWPELPKSGYGKVTKREVKRMLQEADE